MKPSCAPTAYAPMIIPSMTLCGFPSQMLRSMNAPGSPSSALQMTKRRSPLRLARRLPFDARSENRRRPVPRSPDFVIVSMTARGFRLSSTRRSASYPSSAM